MTEFSYQIGGVFLVATLILLLSFCRDLISYELRGAFKKIGLLGIAALLVYAGLHAYLPSVASLHAVFESNEPANRTTAPPAHTNPPTNSAPATNRRKHPSQPAKVTDAEYKFLTQPPPMLHIIVPASQSPKDKDR